ncbi:MAG: hypothetical protein RIR26_1113 [Pseudomonadota bacterium]|jgi:hypothetical protein
MFRFRAWQVHAGMMILLAMTVVYLQAYVFGRMQSPWMQIDLASVLVVYIAVEHLLLGAVVRIFILAALMHMFSGAPDGFYLMYNLLALVLANVFARFFALHKLSSQFLIFAGVFLLKFVLIYGSFSKAQRIVDVWSFVARVSPGFLVTTIFSVPFFALFSQIDGFFDASSRRDHRQELVES